MSPDVRTTNPAQSHPDAGGTGRVERHRRAWLVTGLVVALALLVGSVAGAIVWTRESQNTAVGSTNDGSYRGGMGGSVATGVPDLPGTTVQVTAVDMGAMMGGGARMGLAENRASVPAGTVSLVLLNAGFKTHELVVLPLADGQQPGTRAIGADRKVDETGSLGEASRSGAAGAGDGVEPGTAGWVTLDLPAGRYELVCNLPGHYAAGMYAELIVG